MHMRRESVPVFRSFPRKRESSLGPRLRADGREIACDAYASPRWGNDCRPEYLTRSASLPLERSAIGGAVSADHTAGLQAFGLPTCQAIRAQARGNINQGVEIAAPQALSEPTFDIEERQYSQCRDHGNHTAGQGNIRYSTHSNFPVPKPLYGTAGINPAGPGHCPQVFCGFQPGLARDLLVTLSALGSKQAFRYDACRGKHDECRTIKTPRGQNPRP
jgi:hypothetical protein